MTNKIHIFDCLSCRGNYEYMVNPGVTRWTCPNCGSDKFNYFYRNP